MEIDENDDEDDVIRADAGAELEYQFSFCSGKINRRFYSIIDLDFLREVYITKGAKKNND